MSLCSKVAFYERQILVGTGLVLCLYFLVMDVILYHKFMSVSFVDEKFKKEKSEMQTVFDPLSIKFIMDDPVTHYIMTPLSENLCYYTNFAETFYFITPNVISITHLICGFLSAKYVFSDSLRSRRIGIMLYEFRSFLDSFDGTVYRAGAKSRSYMSDHKTLGYWIDVVSDTLAGFMLCFAILFCLWWKSPPRRPLSALPTISTSPSSNWSTKGFNKGSGEMQEVRVSTRYNEEYSKRFILWRVVCFGAFWGLSSAMWDQSVIKYQKVFTAQLDPVKKALQTEYLHTWTTWWVIWFWRVLGGQSVIQIIGVAVFFDKHWELFRYTQYTGILAVGLLTIVSNYHLSQVRTALGINLSTHELLL